MDNKTDTPVTSINIKYNFFMSNKMISKSDIECLELACKISNLKIVKQIIKYGVKPTTKCLEIACNRSSSLQMIKFLINTHKLVPNKLCIKNILYLVKNKQAKYILEKFTEEFTEEYSDSNSDL